MFWRGEVIGVGHVDAKDCLVGRLLGQIVIHEVRRLSGLLVCL